MNSEVYSSDYGRRTVTHERSIKITKARNGRGAGDEIAFVLDPQTLCFTECGSVQAEGQKVKV